MSKKVLNMSMCLLLENLILTTVFLCIIRIGMQLIDLLNYD